MKLFLHFICVVYFIKQMLLSLITSEEPVLLGIHSEVVARINEINEYEHLRKLGDSFLEQHYPLELSEMMDIWLFNNLNGSRRQWHPTPVLLLGESHGRRSPVGCSPWGH